MITILLVDVIPTSKQTAPQREANGFELAFKPNRY